MERISSECRLLNDALRRWLADRTTFSTKNLMQGKVYFALCDQAVKIGFAKEVSKRLAAIQVSQAQEVRLLGCIDGTQAMERDFHRRFKKHHIRGEWFRLEGRLAEFIEVELASTKTDPERTFGISRTDYQNAVRMAPE